MTAGATPQAAFSHSQTRPRPRPARKGASPPKREGATAARSANPMCANHHACWREGEMLNEDAVNAYGPNHDPIPRGHGTTLLVYMYGDPTGCRPAGLNGAN